MKRILLATACVLSLAAFTASVARADDKPADASATPAKKTHHKKKKSSDSSDKSATGGSTTPTK